MWSHLNGFITLLKYHLTLYFNTFLSFCLYGVDTKDLYYIYLRNFACQVRMFHLITALFMTHFVFEHLIRCTYCCLSCSRYHYLKPIYFDSNFFIYCIEFSIILKIFSFIWEFNTFASLSTILKVVFLLVRYSWSHFSFIS